MSAETTGSALLDIAERTLQAEILPCLDPGQRPAALMIASAMRMVAREIAQVERSETTAAALATILPDTPSARALAQAIREGRCDAHGALHRALWADAAVRTSISKPSALTRIERRMCGLDSDDHDP